MVILKILLFILAVILMITLVYFIIIGIENTYELHLEARRMRKKRKNKLDNLN